MHTKSEDLKDYGGVRELYRGEADDLDLRQYIRTLWRSRVLILATALLCATATFVLGITSERRYEAVVSLAVSRPKLATGTSDTTAVANFIPFVASRSVAAQVIKEFELDKPPHGVSQTAFFGSVVTVEEVKNSTIILVRGSLRDPELVTRLVNRVAELGVQAARNASLQEALQARDDIKLQFDESSQRNERAESRLQKFREATQIEVMKEDVEAALLERSLFLKLSLEIEAQRSKLAMGERELASRTKIDIVKRSIDSEPVLVESARRAANGQTSELLGLQLRSEVVNPVYQDLDIEVAKTRLELAGLERQKAQMMARKLNAPHLKELNDLYAAEAELSGLEMERDLARKLYQEVATSYETARLTVAGRSSALQIVGAAGVPDRPVSRAIVQKTVIAFVVGLVLSAAGVLLFKGLSSAISAS